MMSGIALRNGAKKLEISIDHAVVSVMGEERRPDPAWRETCDCGRVHRWGKRKGAVIGAKRLEEVYWCEDCWNWDVRTVYRCRSCGRTVIPRWLFQHREEKVPGLTRITGQIEFEGRLPRGIQIGDGFRLGRFSPDLQGRCLVTGIERSQTSDGAKRWLVDFWCKEVSRVG